MSAVGNSAATSFNFTSGAVGGTDTVNSKLEYQGFTSYVASNFGDAVTLTATGQNVTGGNGVDTITGGAGLHTVSGGTGNDVFNVTAGTVTINDLGNGVDVLNVRPVRRQLARCSPTGRRRRHPTPAPPASTSPARTSILRRRPAPMAGR